MKCNPILVVPGELDSIFFEIYFKSLKKTNIKNPIILISSVKLIKIQMKKYKFKKKIKIFNLQNLIFKDLDNSSINLINVNFNKAKSIGKKSSESNRYINNCIQKAFEIIKKYKIKSFINGPINKKNFLNKKFLGMTEFISDNFNVKKNAMLIFNKKLSVCPLTTHLPIKLVPKYITRKSLFEKISLIDNFYISKFNKKPRIAVLGLNPHCESILKYNEDEKVIKPAIKLLKKRKFLVDGPLPADTIFLSQNRFKYDVILGMYHDQVLTPIKTLFEYDAINITLGLPFLRVSPDHGPNKNMVGKNLSNPLSLIQSLKFLDKN